MVYFIKDYASTLFNLEKSLFLPLNTAEYIQCPKLDYHRSILQSFCHNYPFSLLNKRRLQILNLTLPIFCSKTGGMRTNNQDSSNTLNVYSIMYPADIVFPTPTPSAINRPLINPENNSMAQFHVDEPSGRSKITIRESHHRVPIVFIKGIYYKLQWDS